MVENTLKRTINVETIYAIPKDGHTYPLILSTNNPPYEELIITLNVKDTNVASKVEI